MVSTCRYGVGRSGRTRPDPYPPKGPRHVTADLDTPLSAASAPGRRRVMVTGIGMITPLGADTASSWAGFLTGRCGIRELDETFAHLPVRIGAPAAVDPADLLPRAQARTMNRGAQFAVLAAREAWVDAGLDAAVVDPHRAGVSVGTIIGGAPALVDASHQLRDKGPRHVSPHASPMTVPNGAAARIAIDLDTRAEARTIVSACASGTEAIGAATDRIRAGHLDIAVAGGTEAVIHPTVMAAFASLRALAPGTDGPQHASKPFDEHRNGFVLGEGAAFLILEAEDHARARGARAYCEIAGWGLSADAHHMTAPRPDGNGIAIALRKALADAGATVADVVHINAHATATPAGDAAEALALHTVFGDHTPPVTAPKGAIGHLQGAAGAVEAALCALTLHHRTIPPTVGHHHPADDLGLDIVTGAPRPLADRSGGIILSDSFGFGGHNAVLALRPA